MYTKLKKINQGFTIVETLIVLAIAALILTIVLIAVPDLQRSARNSDTTTDAQNIASGVSTFEGNNNGLIPNAISLPATDGTVTICSLASAPATGEASKTECSAPTGASATAHVQASEGIYIESSTFNGGTASPSTDGNVWVAFQAECGTGYPSNSWVTLTSNSRAVAILYETETSNSTAAWNCTQE